jgi:glycosyltransferase involved in cell wall biosynthesis
MAGRTYILFSSFFGSPARGGGATLGLDVVREWLARGHHVHVIGATYASPALDDLELFIQSRRLVLHGLISVQDTELGHHLDSELEARVAALITEIKPNVIHIHNFQGLLSGVEAAVKSGVPTVYTALDFGMTCLNWYRFDGSLIPCSGPEKLKCQACVLRTGRKRIQDLPHYLNGIFNRVFLDREGNGHREYLSLRNQKYWRNDAVKSYAVTFSQLKQFTSIVAPSPAVYDSIVAYRGSSDGVFSMLYPLSVGKVPADRKEEVPSSGTPLKLLFLGHNHPIKGWPFFIQVLEALPDGLAVEVTDAGGNRTPFEKSSARAKRYLRNSFRSPSANVSVEMRKSDAILVPSLWHENTPLVVLESLANGRPVIASDQRGISNVIQNGRNGFLIPPGDLPAWVKKITELSRNPSILRNMRANCDYALTPKEFVDKLEGIE